MFDVGTLESAQKAIDAQRKALAKKSGAEGKAAVKSAFKEFFAKHPEFVEVSWRQYIPYFNDGDPCEFSVHEPYFKLANDAGSDRDDDERGHSVWSLEHGKKKGKLQISDESIEAAREVSEKIQSLTDVLKIVFGDHAQVIVTAKEITIEEYQHD